MQLMNTSMRSWPFLILRQVIELMDWKSLINLSVTNKRFRGMILSHPQIDNCVLLSLNQKNSLDPRELLELIYLKKDNYRRQLFINMNRVTVNVIISHEIIIQVSMKDTLLTEWNYRISDDIRGFHSDRTLSFNRIHVPARRENDFEYTTYWTSIPEGFSLLLNYLVKDFDIEVENLYIRTSRFHGFATQYLKPICSRLMSIQSEIKFCFKQEEGNAKLTQDEINYIEKNVKAIENFQRGLPPKARRGRNYEEADLIYEEIHL